MKNRSLWITLASSVAALLVGIGIGGTSTPPAEIVEVPVPGPTVTPTATPVPAPTVTVTATPQPAPTVTVTAEPVPAAEPAPEPQLVEEPQAPAPVAENVYYKNCTEARAAGVTPIYAGEPGYRSALDRDNDGIACE